ncbi:MAG: CocE/NonD family hydrolase [Anaerolineae bacterium]|nr:CocE/NonD family hydrolase [Anaerolineae bacterium]
MSQLISASVGDGVTRIKNVRIPTREGVHLAADLYMPQHQGDGELFPVVMEYSPYRKDDVNLDSRRFYLTLPQQGYVVARVDVRGTGASEGASSDEYTRQEQQDGYDAVEWLAQQPWCDGHVNMMGISYSGFTALQVAALAPPHLTSIIPIDFTDDRYTDDCHYRGGLLRMYYDIAHYGGQMVARNALPPHPEWSGSDWARLWEKHLHESDPYLLRWYRHQTDGPYWRQGSVRDTPHLIRCPAFLIGGWRDGYPNPPLRLYQALEVPRKVLVGPWNHALPDAAVPGPRIDYVREVVRWLDHWCKGVDTGIMDEPPIVVYMQHYQPPVVDRLDTLGTWRAEREWPPPGGTEKVLYLGRDGALAEDVASQDGADSFEYDPTVGVAGGLWSGGIPFGLPGDQRPDEALSLVYTTPPLEQDLCMLGWPRAVLHVSSSASVIGFAVSLSDVAPDGVSHLVAKGMLNATRRESLRDPQLLVPGELYALDIPIDCTGWVFAQGHRVRLSIASADWPNVWPTPQPAKNRVYRGAQRPSRLVLPVVPVLGSAPPPEFQPSPKSVSRHSDATLRSKWHVGRDQLTGRTTVDLRFGADWRISDTAVIERQSSSTFELDPAQPADAAARARHVFRLVRPLHETEACADVAIQATATDFHITIELAVRVNGALHFTKYWAESLPRHLL